MNTLKIAAVLLTILLGACQSNQRTQLTGQPKVTSTTGMVHDLVVNIGGSKVEARVLMGPGVDPHLYKASQSDLGLITSADIIFYNGLHLEGKMAEVLRKLGRKKTVVAVADSIPEHLLIQVSSTAYDPHVWFDIALWKMAGTAVLHTLIRANPTDEDYYLNNYNAYMALLDSTDDYVKTQLAQIPAGKRVLVTAHDAFGYYGRAYGLRVEALQGISTVAEIGLSNITNTTEMIKNLGIKAIFAETSVSNRSVQAVIEGCRAKGVDLQQGGYLYSDALGAAGSEAGTYTGMIRTNTDMIVKALK